MHKKTNFRQHKLNINLVYKPNRRLEEARTLANFKIKIPKLIIDDSQKSKEPTNLNLKQRDCFNYNLNEKTYQIFIKNNKFLNDLVIEMNGKSRGDILKRINELKRFLKN